MLGWDDAIMLVAPTLLSALFGPKGSDINAMRSRAKAYLTPEAIAAETRNQVADLLNSPAYLAARSQAVQAGQMGGDYINTRLAQTGLGRTGVGLAMEGAMRAAPDVQMAQMTGMLQSQAAQRAMELQQMRANAEFTGGPVRPMWQDMLGGTIAAGLPYILDRTKGTTTTGGTTKPKNAKNETPLERAQRHVAEYTQQTPTYGGTQIPIDQYHGGPLYPASNQPRITTTPQVLAGRRSWKPLNAFEPDLPVYANGNVFDFINRKRHFGIPNAPYGAGAGFDSLYPSRMKPWNMYTGAPRMYGE